MLIFCQIDRTEEAPIEMAERYDDMDAFLRAYGFDSEGRLIDEEDNIYNFDETEIDMLRHTNTLYRDKREIYQLIDLGNG